MCKLVKEAKGFLENHRAKDSHGVRTVQSYKLPFVGRYVQHFSKEQLMAKITKPRCLTDAAKCKV
jgi:hypothetical protein